MKHYIDSIEHFVFYFWEKKSPSVYYRIIYTKQMLKNNSLFLER